MSYHEQQILFHSHQLHQWKKLSSPNPPPSPSPLPSTRPPISDHTRRRMAPIMAGWKWSRPSGGKENATPHPSPAELEKRMRGGLGKGVKFAPQAVVIGQGEVPVNDPPPPPYPHYPHRHPSSSPYPHSSTHPYALSG